MLFQNISPICQQWGGKLCLDLLSWLHVVMPTVLAAGLSIDHFAKELWWVNSGGAGMFIVKSDLEGNQAEEFTSAAWPVAAPPSAITVHNDRVSGYFTFCMFWQAKKLGPNAAFSFCILRVLNIFDTIIGKSILLQPLILPKVSFSGMWFSCRSMKFRPFLNQKYHTWDQCKSVEISKHIWVTWVCMLNSEC